MIDASLYDAVSFDVYGTLLNWEPEIASFLVNWSKSSGRTISASDLLQRYDSVRQPIQERRPALPYPDVLKETLRQLGDELDLDVSHQALADFSGIAATHKPFPDSETALADLRGMGFKLAALSNIDEKSFKRAMSGASLSFDVVVTAQRVGAYKPDPNHFWAALADLLAIGIPMHRVLHVAQSKRADIVVANQIGLTSVWVNRSGHIFGRTGRGAEGATADYEVESLAHLVQLLRR